MKDYLDFGVMNVKKLCWMIFLFGTVFVAAASVQTGHAVYRATFYDKLVQSFSPVQVSAPVQVNGNSVEVPAMDVYVQNASTVYTSMRVNNLPLGIFCGLLVFAAGIALWRFACEAIYIILIFYKTNAKPDSEPAGKPDGEA